jgi:hypothetical protein
MSTENRDTHGMCSSFSGGTGGTKQLRRNFNVFHDDLHFPILSMFLFFPFFCPDFGRFHGIPFGSTGAVEERAAAVHRQSQGGH